MVTKSAADVIAMARAGAEAVKAREITRDVPFTLPGHAPVTLTLAMPDPERLRLEVLAARPEIRDRLVAEWARLRRGRADAPDENAVEEFSRQIAQLDTRVEEGARLAAFAGYLLAARDPASPEGTPCVRLGWLVALGLPLTGYRPDMADDLAPWAPELAPLLLAHSPLLARFVDRALFQHEEYFRAVAEEERKNSSPPPSGTPGAAADAANAATGNSGRPGGPAPSSGDSDEIPPEESSTDA